MTARPRNAIKLLLALAAMLGASACGPEGSPQINQSAPHCAASANEAALQAVGRTNPLGQMQVYGNPFAIAPNVLRVEVDVFGPQNPTYSVDVSIDQACRVLSASARLVSHTDIPR
jgi:ABC-type phosphate transport system substrate-binding protein